uniref:Uncharacterized protein n=1 Tax=Octopus bimaculoides TaxID=37653 RepID=A0A0L8HR03_OCTBM
MEFSGLLVGLYVCLYISYACKRKYLSYQSVYENILVCTSLYKHIFIFIFQCVRIGEYSLLYTGVYIVINIYLNMLFFIIFVCMCLCYACLYVIFVYMFI